MRLLQHRGEVLVGEFAITENACQQARTNCFPRMEHDRYPPVGMTKEMVAPLDSRHFESLLAQGIDDLSTGDARQARHDTVICWMPMKSSGSVLSSCTSRHSSTA